MSRSEVWGRVLGGGSNPQSGVSDLSGTVTVQAKVNYLLIPVQILVKQIIDNVTIKFNNIYCFVYCLFLYYNVTVIEVPS